MSLVITLGFGENQLVPTLGFGTSGGYIKTEVGEKSTWIEGLCNPAGYDESMCIGVVYEEDQEVLFERLDLVTPIGSFKEAGDRETITQEPPPEVTKFGGARPGGSLNQRRFSPLNPTPQGRFMGFHEARILNVFPAGSFKEALWPVLTSTPPSSITLKGPLESEDTYIEAGLSVNLNFGGNKWIFIRRSSSGNERIGLIRFLAHGIPNTATIISATLSLWLHAQLDQVEERDLIVNRMLQQAWTELGATYNNYDGSNPWNTPGAKGIGTDYSTTSEARLPIQGTAVPAGTRYDVDVATVVQEAVSAGDTNIDLRLDIEGPFSSLWQFRSSEEDAAAGEEPQLTVVYVE